MNELLIEKALKNCTSPFCFLLASVILIPGMFGLWYLLFIPYLILVWLVIYQYLKMSSAIKKAIIFSTYLKASSSLQKYSGQSTFTSWKNTICSFILAVLATAFLSSLSLWEFVAILIGSCLGLSIASLLVNFFLEHANSAFKSLTKRSWNQTGAVVGASIALAIYGITSNYSSDYAIFSSVDIADHVIETTKHPVKFIQHYARTIEFMDIQILKLRDNLGGKAGFILFIYFILPSLLPLYALTSAVKGLIYGVTTLDEENKTI